MSGIDPQKIAIYRELLKRKDQLPPEKQAVLGELGKRFAVEAGGDPTGKMVEPPSILSGVVDTAKRVAKDNWDVATGAGQHLTKTLLNTAKLPAKVLPGRTSLALSRMAEGVEKHINVPLEPQNPAQAYGGTVANIGEFVAGGEALAPVKAAVQAKTAIPLLKTAIGAAFEGAGAAGVTAAQQGSTENIAAPALTAATLSAAIPAAAGLLKKVALKIEDVAVKATAADRANGFKTANIFKYNVGGSLEQSLTKTEERLGNLRAMATQLRANGTPVDLNAILIQTAKDLAGNAPRNTGMNAPILAAIQKEADEIGMLMNMGHVQQNGVASIDVAYDVLKSVGERGAWKYGMRDLDSVAAEKVANALYTNLRKAVEASSQNDSALQEVNRAMMDLIPIKTALIRRIPVAARNEALSLPEVVALASGSIPLGATSRVLKNPRAANAAMGAANKIAPAADVLARTGAAATPKN